MIIVEGEDVADDTLLHQCPPEDDLDAEWLALQRAGTFQAPHLDQHWQERRYNTALEWLTDLLTRMATV